ncbi:relaxase/mobilization nuclease domain-containing protein [Pedobacter sp. UC225_65]|uniref:relaxase/mobilization nuclease domain-containing protein n=1 Tax=Pedobacter sp. UC225_65 TaxID=3350173 RepID=UPI00366FE8BF
MVAKIDHGGSIRGILHYNENKVVSGQAKLVLASGFATEIKGLNFHQKLYRFELLNQLRPSVKVNALHITLNFHAEDRLDATRLQQIAAEYMERIGFGEQPYIAYQHFDAHHPHLHIATTRIGRDGKAIDINKIGWRLSEPARKEIEEKYGLIRAQGRGLKNEPYLRTAQYGGAPTKQQLNNITKGVMRDYAYTSFAEFKAVLAQFGVHVDRGFEDSVMFEKKGLVYSIADSDGNPVGVPFKASSFYKGATMKELEKRFEGNGEKRKAFRESLKDRIDGVMDRYSAVRKETFVKQLAREQVALVLRRNETGLVYGLTFIDHRHRTVFNGSDLGKGYAAKAVVGMFSDRDVAKQYLRKETSMDFLEKDLGLGGKRGKAEEGLLDGLLEKADYDGPTVIGKKRKKRAGEEHSREYGI